VPRLDGSFHRSLDLGGRDAPGGADDNDLTMTGGLERETEPACRLGDPRRLDRSGLAQRRCPEEGGLGGRPGDALD
jgi:hypothetical protein